MANAAEVEVGPFPLPYLVVALMSVLAAFLAGALAGLFVSDWRPGAYLPAAAVAIGAAVLIREAIARERPSAAVVAAVRARELLVLVLAAFPAALILRYLPWDPLGLVDMLLNIWFEPQTYIDGRDLLTAALLIGAWAFPIRPLEYLERLVVTPRDIPRPSRADGYDMTAVRMGLPDLSALHRKLTSWVLGTLALLAVASGVFWQGFGTGMQARVGAALLLYAALGFTLLALANYELRRSRWLIEGVAPEGQSADLWALAGGGLTVGLTVLAVLLPAVLLLAVMRAIISAVLLVFFRLMHAMGTATPGVGSGAQPYLPRPPILPPPLLPQQQRPPATMPDWLVPVAIALAVFLVGLGVLWFATWLRRSGRGPRLRWLRPFAGLLAFLAGLGLSLRQWLASLRGAVTALALRVGRAPRATAARLQRTRRRPGGSGAELVRYWYGQMVRQGRRSGLPRRPGQTAAEYRQAVRQHLAAAAPALDELTDAYVAARYSGRRVAPERAAASEAHFRRVRQAMAAWLRRRRGREAPPESGAG